MVFVFQSIKMKPVQKQDQEPKLKGRYVVDPSYLTAGLENPKINPAVVNDITKFFTSMDINKGKGDMVVSLTKPEIKKEIVERIFARVDFDKLSRTNFTEETGYKPTLQGVQDYYDQIVFPTMIKPALTPIVVKK